MNSIFGELVNIEHTIYRAHKINLKEVREIRMHGNLYGMVESSSDNIFLSIYYIHTSIKIIT